MNGCRRVVVTLTALRVPDSRRSERPREQRLEFQGRLAGVRCPAGRAQREEGARQGAAWNDGDVKVENVKLDESLSGRVTAAADNGSASIKSR
jgi:hypothetical protein